MNRNRNIGEKGANMDKVVFEKYLADMAFNEQQVCCLHFGPPQ